MMKKEKEQAGDRKVMNRGSGGIRERESDDLKSFTGFRSSFLTRAISYIEGRATSFLEGFLFSILAPFCWYQRD